MSSSSNGKFAAVIALVAAIIALAEAIAAAAAAVAAAAAEAAAIAAALAGLPALLILIGDNVSLPPGYGIRAPLLRGRSAWRP